MVAKQRLPRQRAERRALSMNPQTLCRQLLGHFPEQVHPPRRLDRWVELQTYVPSCGKCGNYKIIANETSLALQRENYSAIRPITACGDADRLSGGRWRRLIETYTGSVKLVRQLQSSVQKRCHRLTKQVLNFLITLQSVRWTKSYLL
jgi:hypothetical protein